MVVVTMVVVVVVKITRQALACQASTSVANLRPNVDEFEAKCRVIRGYTFTPHSDPAPITARRNGNWSAAGRALPLTGPLEGFCKLNIEPLLIDPWCLYQSFC